MKGTAQLCAGLVGLALPMVVAAAAFPAPTVRTAAVIATEMAPVLWAPGTVVSRNDARIAAEVDGRITHMAEPGEVFAVGAVIARLDDQPLRLTLAESEADIGRFEARLAYSASQLVRLSELAKRDSASQTQLDQVTSDRDALRKQLNRARASRDRAAYNLERAVITAPFGGQWVERRQQVGEFTRTGTVLGRLVDIENKEIRARAPMQVAPWVATGMPVDVTAGEPIGAFEVRVVIPVGDVISRSLEIRVAIPPEGPLIGTAVRVAVPTGATRQVLAVPRDALVIRQAGAHVHRIVESTAKQTMVEVGTGQGDLIAVVGSVQAGDQVVVRGAERLRDGQAVRVPADTETGDAAAGH